MEKPVKTAQSCALSTFLQIQMHIDTLFMKMSAYAMHEFIPLHAYFQVKSDKLDMTVTSS